MSWPNHMTSAVGSGAHPRLSIGLPKAAQLPSMPHPARIAPVVKRQVAMKPERPGENPAAYNPDTQRTPYALAATLTRKS